MLTTFTTTLSHTFVDHALPTDRIAESSMLIDLHLLDAYPFQVQLVQEMANLLIHLLQVTPEMISRLVIRPQTSRTSSLIPSMASQLLANGAVTISILSQVTTTTNPALQLAILRILRLLADQLSGELFASLFTAHLEEASSIFSACNHLLSDVLFSSHRNRDLDLATPTNLPETASREVIQAEAGRVLLDLLVAHAEAPFPSPTSVLLSLPHSLQTARAIPPRMCLLNTLIAFLEHPELVFLHAVLAGKVVRMFFLLCSHHDVGIGKAINSV